MKTEEISKLKKRAQKLRKEVFDMFLKEGEGHLGGSFSCIEILVSLYKQILTEKDKFILSKGHACYPFYILLCEQGYNPKISGHPEIDQDNGISCTTGSLGHGLPIGLGMALAKKLQNKNGRIYVLMSDGEVEEGTTWESSLLACHHQLDNLTVIIDYNKIQALEFLDNVVSLGNLKNKFQNIGYHTLEIDGHSFSEIIQALKENSTGKPLIVIAHTVKGRGVRFMENNPAWHIKKAKDLSKEEIKEIYKELSI